MKYSVIVTGTAIYKVDVEADNEEDAAEKVYDMTPKQIVKSRSVSIGDMSFDVISVNKY